MGVLATALGLVAAVMAMVGAAPAQAGSVQAENACRYNFDGLYHILPVTLSAPNPASVAAGQPVTLSGLRIQFSIPKSYVDAALATYEGDRSAVIHQGDNTVPVRLYLAIAASNTAQGNLVSARPLSDGYVGHIQYNANLDPTTDIVVDVPMPDLTFTASSAGTVNFRQADPGHLGTLVGAGIGNGNVTPDNSFYGGGSLFPGGPALRGDCAVGEAGIGSDYSQYTPATAAPFATATVGTPGTTAPPTTAPPTTAPPTTAPPTTGPPTTVGPGGPTTTAPTSFPQTGTWQCISGLGRQAAAANGGSTEILPLDITLSTGQTAQAAAGQVRLRQPRVTVAIPELYFLREYRNATDGSLLALGPNTYPIFVWLAVQGSNTREGIQTMALETTYTVTVLDGGGNKSDGNESIAEADPTTHNVTLVFTLPTTLWTPLAPGPIEFAAAPQGTMSTIGVQGQGEGNNPYQVNPYGSVFIRQHTAVYGSNLDCINGTVAVNTGPGVPSYSNFGRLVSTGRYTINAATNAPFRIFNVTATNSSALSYQVITVNVVGRPLSFDALAHTVSMASAGPGEVATGALKPLTVKDPRGTNSGWTVTGQVTPTAGPLTASTLTKSPDFVSTSPTGEVKTIPANNLGWRPSASLAPGQPPGGVAQVVPGPALTDQAQPWIDGLGTPRTLCSAPAGHSGGSFVCNAALYLGIPGDAARGTYTGNLTLTLS